MTRVRIGVLALVLTGACVRVQPHAREHLARRAMDPAGDEQEKKLDAHVEDYREGSIGGTGAGGGGCGCN